MFGDNRLATDFNPRALNGPSLPPLNPANPRPLDPHPSTDPTRRIEGYLQHAPYAFRTLTTPAGTAGFGALDYIDAILPVLPSEHPERGTVTHVLVHCLPGLYGPLLQGQSDIDPRSGIPYNGEEFPVVVDRDRIGIQGVSALDTVFDARGQPVAVFEAGGLQMPDVNVDSFVDSVAVRGARGSSQSAVPAGAGFYVRGPGVSRLQITNCMIYDNTVGIALDATSTPNAFTPHRITVVNDTIAWNVIGVWAGDTGTQQTNPHASAFVNVIFDPASPALPPGAPPIAPGFSCFEGLRDGDFRVLTRGIVPIGEIFNAWVAGLENLGGPYPPAAAPWTPVGTGVAGIPPVGAPRVDLTPYAVQPRTLYINDAFRNSPVGGVGVDYSLHDFRLSPNVAPDGSPPGAGSPTNPLVNAGIDGGPLLNQDIRMVNNVVIPGQGPGWPSEPPNHVEDAFIGAWDYDAEGFGNPRIATPAGYPLIGDDYGEIDIGADEVDELIVAGFWEHTRIFASLVPGAVGVPPGFLPPHDRVYFFGLAGTAGAPRPQTNSYLGREFAWYEHIQAPTDALVYFGAPSNYTSVPFPLSLRHQQIVVGGSGSTYKPIMRNLECDFSPHLLLDIHPFWPELLSGVDIALPEEDPYASNPWYHNDPIAHPSGSVRRYLVDSPALYNNLFLAAHALPDYLPWTPFSFTAVVQATLNPPGTFYPATEWILAPSASFGPFAPCSAASLAFGPWGFNDSPSGCPDRIPYLAGEDGLGRRYNLEVGPGESNLQTFLRVQGGVLPPEGESRNTGWEDLRQSMARIADIFRGRL